MNASDTASFYREFHPAAGHPFVECWWEQSVDERAGGYVQRVLPDACADVIVSSDGRATVVGPATSVQLPRLAAGTSLRGLRLRTAAIGTALGLPADEIRDRELPLSDVFPASEAARIAERVWQGDRTAAVPVPDERDERVEHALNALRRPAARVADVAADLNLSERHLRRLVLSHTGLEPRTLRRVVRLQRFLRLSAGRERSLADLAARAGYADQAHLSREVRALSGLTPTALLAERL
ncbi:helix-turn-helix domain-containing protein [Actinomadura sp. DC4]|uniref:helix-turn-helix domain-containing protein n=1 Tax=Actinomadura sp. DC4 TaxID=3055069 RepID=UPI0025B1BA7C|nr:helix-turn-helix domain-containing protein [Actinomadura sp. DC4]MDN3359453.1 helix-turn-helix domain-containing protein [Actinomadura sp. DC4]